MTPRRTAGLAAGLLMAAAAATAQEPKVDPKAPPKGGAQPGQVIPSPFRAFLVTDGRFPPKVPQPSKAEDRDPRDRTRKIHDLVGENGLSPVVAVFVRPGADELAGPGVVKLIQAVDKKVPQYRGDKLAAFVQFLKIGGMPKTVSLVDEDTKTTTPVPLDAEFPDDEKRDEYADEVAKLANTAAAPNVPFGLAPANGKAAAAWGIGAEDAVTVVLYNRMRVAKRWTFPLAGPSDEQVAEVIRETEAMITGPRN